MDGAPQAVDYGICPEWSRPGGRSRSTIPVTKLLPLTGMVVSGLVGILFLADLAAGFPFRRVSVGLDIGFVIASLILAYLSWSVVEKARP